MIKMMFYTRKKNRTTYDFSVVHALSSTQPEMADFYVVQLCGKESSQTGQIGGVQCTWSCTHHSVSIKYKYTYYSTRMPNGTNMACYITKIPHTNNIVLELTYNAIESLSL